MSCLIPALPLKAVVPFPLSSFSGFLFFYLPKCFLAWWVPRPRLLHGLSDSAAGTWVGTGQRREWAALGAEDRVELLLVKFVLPSVILFKSWIRISEFCWPRSFMLYIWFLQEFELNTFIKGFIFFHWYLLSSQMKCLLIMIIAWLWGLLYIRSKA